MKKILIHVTVVALLIACNNAPKGDEAETVEKKEAAATTGVIYKLDSSGSSIQWTASKPGRKHIGIFKLKEGSLSVKDNALTGGSFTIDIASISNQDMASDPANKTKLEGHLKSPDFFDVAKYPTAKFEITAIAPFVIDSTKQDNMMKDATHTVSGNLTLKDSTKNISFPARITLDPATLSASANFNIDRTEWGMNYKGPGNPQDWFINKQVNIQFSLAASKK